MTVRSKILEALKSGPATSSELSERTQEFRGNVKVALVTMVKRGLVEREKVDRNGKGPKTVYRYRLKETA